LCGVFVYFSVTICSRLVWSKIIKTSLVWWHWLRTVFSYLTKQAFPYFPFGFWFVLAWMAIARTFSHSAHLLPERRPGMSDVSLLSGISGLSFDSSFLSPHLLVFFCQVLMLFLSCHFSANGPFFWLFSRKLSNNYVSLRVRLFCMALVEQLGDDSW